MPVEVPFLHSESFLHYLINASPDPTFAIDNEGRVIIWNQAITDLTGVAPEDIIGQGGYAHGHAIYHQNKPILADLLLNPEMEKTCQYEDIHWHEGRSSAETENTVPHSGKHLWAKASLLKDNEGKSVGVLETIRDITESKNTERIIIENEKRIRRLTENMSDVVCELDINGAYVFTSDSCRRMLGFEPDDLRGVVFLTRIHREDRNIVYYAYQCLMSGWEVPAMIFRHIHKQGHYIWLEAVAAPIIEDDYTITGMVCSLRDYSYRIETEKGLQLAAGIYANTVEGIIVTDETGKILDINPAGCSIIEGAAHTMIGSNILDSLLWPNGVQTEDGKAIRYKELVPWRGEIEGFKQNGEKMVALGSISRVSEGPGGGEVYVGIFTDQTEQVRFRKEQEALKEQMARVQKMASLSAMSAGIVHEIAQPLNAIKLLADTMLYWHKRGRAFDVGQAIDKISSISQQVNRVAEIIDHIRSFASASQTRNFEPFSVNEAVTGAMKIMGQQLANHEIRVELDLSNELPDVMGNLHRLEEVIINLLVNAMNELDQCPAGLKVVSCSTSLRNGRIILQLGDSGRGVPEENLVQIFEPFFSTKSARDNMGLGLAIAQSVISSFNGNIWAGNSPPGGASFTIDFPAYQGTAAVQE